MKQIISVLSNTHYTQDEKDTEFVLKPMMELIISKCFPKTQKVEFDMIKELEDFLPFIKIK